MTDDRVKEALARVKRLRDGGAVEEVLIKEVMQAIVLEPEEEQKRRIAKHLINSVTKPNSTKPDGQLLLPGIIQHYPYEPERLIRDEEGRIIEQSKATPAYKAAEAARASKHAEEAAYHSRIKNEEANQFSQWAINQIRKGRSQREIQWGIFIIETGIWTREDDIPGKPSKKKSTKMEPV